MDRQTCATGFTRYNAEGVEGLLDRPRSGRKPLLSESQLAEFGRLAETQPDPVADGVVRRSQGSDRKALQRRTLGALGGSHPE